MWTKIVVVFIFGGLVGLDTTAAWQVLFSHPLFACSLLGLAFGEPQLGIFFGIIFELVWLHDLPVGGARFPEGNQSSFVGLMLVLTFLPQSGIAMPWLVLFSCIYAVIVAYLFSVTISLMRRLNFYFVKRADRYAQAGEAKGIERMHLLALLHTYFHGAVWGLFFYLVGFALLKPLLTRLPATALFQLAHLQAIFLGVGLAIMGKLFFSRRKIHYLISGLICGVGLATLF